MVSRTMTGRSHGTYKTFARDIQDGALPPSDSIASRWKATLTGNKGLQCRESLIFEKANDERTGVEFELPDAPRKGNRLGEIEREGKIGLPGISEGLAIRHYVRLSKLNYNIDQGIYPLGSCTMKYNPRVNEKVARYPGFSAIHPLQPVKTVQGALEVMYRLQEWLGKLTGMERVAMSPAAGAHGELCGMMCIRQALVDRGDHEERKIVLVPASAHGTNPATAVMCGFKPIYLDAKKNGRIDLEDLKRKMDGRVAAMMLTNPNTCGLFESEIAEAAHILHENGSFFYCDGANFNALLGRVRVADLGVDAMHINLHKTFSTPHGGGGPGSGPVVLSERLAKYAPIPYVQKTEDGSYRLVESFCESGADTVGRLKGFHGQMGMFVRALAYCMAHGVDGLRQVSGDAVLNANYLSARLRGVFSHAYPNERCMHEVLFSDEFLKGTGVSTLDLAKALLDEGFHPYTMYWPLVVNGAMLMEPTETESKESLDAFADTLLYLAKEAKAGNKQMFKEAPVYTPVRRADETLAARKPVLTWMEKAERRAMKTKDATA